MSTVSSSTPAPAPVASSSPLDSALPSNAKMERFRRERDALLASSSFYELLQQYKANIHRANSKKDFVTASLLALDGATTLLRHGQGNAGGELAIALVGTYSQQSLPPSPPIISSLLSLFWAFPASSSTSRVSFIKAAIKWSVGERVRKRGHADLHLSFARWYAAGEEDRGMEERDWASSHRHYLLAAGASAVNARLYGAHVPATFSPPPPPPASSSSSSSSSSSAAEHNTYSEHASLLLTWLSHGLPSEAPLFITRAVLQYLALADLRGAHAVLDYSMTRLPAPLSSALSAYPLIHFLQFLLRLCERGGEAGELYDVLRGKYRPVLGGQEEGLEPYLERIGEVFFGREAKKSLLDSLLT
jgi:hypothetical protein